MCEGKTLKEVERLLFDKGLKIRNLERNSRTVLITGSDKDWKIVETWDLYQSGRYVKREV